MAIYPEQGVGSAPGAGGGNLGDTIIVADAAARKALAYPGEVQLQDRVRQTDTGVRYVLIGTDPTLDASWEVDTEIHALDDATYHTGGSLSNGYIPVTGDGTPPLQDSPITVHNTTKVVTVFDSDGTPDKILQIGDEIVVSGGTLRGKQFFDVAGNLVGEIGRVDLGGGNFVNVFTLYEIAGDVAYSLGVRNSAAALVAQLHGLGIRLGNDTSDTATGKFIDVADGAGGKRFSVNGTTGALETIGQIKTTAGRLQAAKGANVVAANDLTLGTDGNLFIITGNTQINAITTANWQAGAEITLHFTGTPTIKHNTAGGAGTARIKFEAATDLAATATTKIDLRYDGTDWLATASKSTQLAAEATAAAALASHVADSDPHTGYQKESEKGSASGYAGLNANSNLTATTELNPSALTSDLTGIGEIETVIVDVNATGIGAALYIAADFHYEETDADAAATMPCVAIALETSTGTKKVLKRGLFRNDAWNWAAGLLYVSLTTGALTQDVSGYTTGDVVQVVGYAVSADIIYFDPSLVLAVVA